MGCMSGSYSEIGSFLNVREFFSPVYLTSSPRILIKWTLNLVSVF